jgi:hypothetical protein
LTPPVLELHTQPVSDSVDEGKVADDGTHIVNRPVVEPYRIQDGPRISSSYNAKGSRIVAGCTLWMRML